MDTVRIAQVGIGYWGRNLIRNFAAVPGVAVIQACDQRAPVLKQVSEQFPQIKTTERYEDVLENPEVDAVVVATETPLHFEMARTALEAGKHVFVEKPMAQSVAEAEALVRIAEERNLRLMVGHLLLYHPAFRYIEDLIQAGELGEVYYLYSMRVNLGIVRQKENALESLAPHDLSVALAFLSGSPVSVSAQGHAYLQPGVEDVVFGTVYFDGGQLAHVHTSWLDPHKVRKVTVVGSRKMAVIDDVEGVEKVRLYDKGVDIAPGEKRYVDYAEAMTIRSGDIHIPKIDMREPLRLECQHFVESVRNGTRPRSDGQNGLMVVRILEAAQQSLRQDGSTVAV
ncbi:MAG TPA: Gfo/Idh/MocA family oxidoreductase [Rhodothermales bacterium]